MFLIFKLTALFQKESPLPFSTGADFGIMAENVFISKVIHQTFINVDEKGTEAAAATMAMMMCYSSYEPERVDPIDFKCNRPFIFVIHDQENNGILFIGKYTKP